MGSTTFKVYFWSYHTFSSLFCSLYFNIFSRKYLKLTKMEITRFATKLFICWVPRWLHVMGMIAHLQLSSWRKGSQAEQASDVVKGKRPSKAVTCIFNQCWLLFIRQVPESGGFRGGAADAPPPLKFWSTRFFCIPFFKIRMLKNKAQIARESIQNQRASRALIRAHASDYSIALPAGKAIYLGEMM